MQLALRDVSFTCIKRTELRAPFISYCQTWVYNREQKSFKKEEVTSPRALSYSNFIIHLKSHTVLFEERMPYISINQFREIFSILYKRYFKDLSDIKIDFILDKEKIFDLLRRYDKITEVRLKVEPTNPEDEDEYRKLDQLLKASNTEEANLKFQNKKDGLDVEDSIIKEGIMLSGAGYGNYEIVVEKEEKREIKKSKDQIIRKIVRAIDDPKELIDKYWEKLKEYLTRD